MNKPRAPRPMRLAFSLVELSVVFVILGLLVGGVLSGRALIRASELQSITTQYNQYNVAVLAFRDKYSALPGDMPTATRVWGAVDVPASCDTTPSTDQRTCDGNGDGKIGNGSTGYENARAWQHLANAGLVDGQYEGIDGNKGPKGKISKSYWSISEMLDYAVYSAGAYFVGDYSNCLFINGYIAPTRATIPFLKPEDAWSIDTKTDDGMPATGKIAAFPRTLSSCTNTASATTLTAQYLLSGTTTNRCALVFCHQF